MTLNSDSLNEELKIVNAEDEPLPSTSRHSLQPTLFGSDNLNLLSTDTISLNGFNPTDSNSADDVSQMMKNVDVGVEPTPSTSRLSSQPVSFGSDNLNILSTGSLNPTDLNSADDVRQGVKYMELRSQVKEPQKNQLSRETLEPGDEESHCSKQKHRSQEPQKIQLCRVTIEPGNQEPQCSKQKHKSRTKLMVAMKERSDNEPQGKTDTNRKRVGRPAKAGPSKKLKKDPSATHFYKGKLKNYVRSRKNRQSSSDSDIESCEYASS